MQDVQWLSIYRTTWRFYLEEYDDNIMYYFHWTGAKEAELAVLIRSHTYSMTQGIWWVRAYQN